MMNAALIGPFSIAKTNSSAAIVWPLLGPDLKGDVTVTIRISVPALATFSYEIGLIDFVTRLGNLLLSAFAFGTSGDEDDFGGYLPELNVKVSSLGKAQFSFFGKLDETEYDALSVFRELVLLGDAEMLPVITAGGLTASVTAPTIGISLGVRAVKMTFPE